MHTKEEHMDATPRKTETLFCMTCGDEIFPEGSAGVFLHNEDGYPNDQDIDHVAIPEKED